MGSHTQNNTVDESPAREVYVAVCSACVCTTGVYKTCVFDYEFVHFLATAKFFDSERFLNEGSVQFVIITL